MKESASMTFGISLYYSSQLNLKPLNSNLRHGGDNSLRKARKNRPFLRGSSQEDLVTNTSHSVDSL